MCVLVHAMCTTNERAWAHLSMHVCGHVQALPPSHLTVKDKKRNLHIRAPEYACMVGGRIWNGISFCSPWLHTSSIHLSALRHNASPCCHGAINHCIPMPYGNWSGEGEKTPFNGILPPISPTTYVPFVRPAIRPFRSVCLSPCPKHRHSLRLFI